MCTIFCRLLLRNRVAANGHYGSPCHLCRCVPGLVVGELLLHLHTSEVCKTIGIVFSSDLAGADLRT